MYSGIDNLVRDDSAVDGDCSRLPTAIEIPFLALARFPLVPEKVLLLCNFKDILLSGVLELQCWYTELKCT